jgi:predicted DCC family thiol-disulfide oxidoreductase YuxK
MRAHGTIYFDASCGLCSASARKLRRFVCPHGFELVPLQDADAIKVPGLAPGEVPDEMKLRTSDGNVFGGADAIVCVARQIWWAWPVWLVSRIPGAMPVIRVLYRRLADNRHRISGVCRV